MFLVSPVYKNCRFLLLSKHKFYFCTFVQNDEKKDESKKEGTGKVGQDFKTYQNIGLHNIFGLLQRTAQR